MGVKTCEELHYLASSDTDIMFGENLYSYYEDTVAKIAQKKLLKDTGTEEQMSNTQCKVKNVKNTVHIITLSGQRILIQQLVGYHTKKFAHFSMHIVTYVINQ